MKTCLKITTRVVISLFIIIFVGLATGAFDGRLLNLWSKVATETRQKANNTLNNMSISYKDYFSEDYREARARFKEAGLKAGARMSQIRLDANGPEGEVLTIDIAWLGNPEPLRVIIHTSGLHGVEGFAGSAIQLALLESNPSVPKDSALIFVHILNPYGMAWLRRFNESNVDLNRNFRFSQGDWSIPSKTYAELDSFLNPTKHKLLDPFLLQAAIKIKKYGHEKLRQVIAGGQSENSRGLFYIGEQLEQGPVLYMTWLQKSFSETERLFIIDVHTGLGHFYQESLFHKISATDSTALSVLIDRPVIQEYADAAQVQYEFLGGHCDVFRRLYPEKEIDFITQEFGTFTGTHLLYALRDENRHHHFGDTNINHQSKMRLKEAFITSNSKWQMSVISDGLNLFDRVRPLILSNEESRQ